MALVSIGHIAPHVQSSRLRDKGADGSIVVREERGKFYYFADFDQLIDVYSATIDAAKRAGGHPSVHEVITPSRVQRVRFDLDIRLGNDGDPQITDVFVLIEQIIAAVCAVYHADYHPVVDVTATDFLVTCANGPSKFSYHVLTPIYCNNVYTCQQFTNAVMLKLEMVTAKCRGIAARLWDCIDQGVTKTYQDFRMPLSCKIEAPERPKLPDPAWCHMVTAVWTDFLIGWYEDMAPPHFIEDIGVIPMKAILNQPAEMHTKSTVVLDMCREYWVKHWGTGAMKFDEVWRLRSEINNTYYFLRLMPHACEICKEPDGTASIHEHDNTLIVQIGSSRETAPVRWGCRRAIDASKSSGGLMETRIKIASISGTSIRETIQARVMAKVETLNAPTHIVSEHRARIYAQLRKLRFVPSQLCLEAKPELMDFPICRTLYVRAAMKMGKTAKLVDFMGKVRPETAVYVSFRQTFSEAIVARLNGAGYGFESYSAIKTSSIDLALHPFVVVQVESLGRLRIGHENPTILILDEVESVLSQFTSPYVQNVSLVYALFQRLVGAATHVICMDANLSDRTLRLIEGMRAGAGTTPQVLGDMIPRFYYENYERNAAGDHMWILGSAAQLYNQMASEIRAGRRIVLCSSSLDEAKCIMMALSRDFVVDDVCGPKASYGADVVVTGEPPEGSRALRVGMYTAETSPSIKQRDFSDVNRWWGELDVLIYTPTVTAGVSFDIEHFDVMFGVFTSLSCDAETCRQMMGRVRKVRRHEYYVFLQVIDGSYPTDRSIVSRLLMNTTLLRESRIMPEGVQEPMVTSIQDGEIVSEPANYFDVVVENIIHQNWSRNRFGDRFLEQVAETGVTLHYLLDEATPAGKAGTYNKGLLRDAAAEIQARRIIAAESLAPDQYVTISQARVGKTAAAQFITADDMIRARKTFLMMLYLRLEPEVTYDWVRTFNGTATVRIFQNLLEVGSAITWGLTPTETLVGADASLVARYGTGPKSLKRWFVCRIMHHLDQPHLGSPLTFEISVLESVVAALEGDLTERLTRARTSGPRGPNVWALMVFEFDMPSGRKTPRQIVSHALLAQFGINMRCRSTVPITFVMEYPDAIMRQVVETYQRQRQRGGLGVSLVPFD